MNLEQPGRDIRDEILRSGPITFARFMELALYLPGSGYYERKREIGQRGDFFTSVSVGPVFGQLLAFQFAEWLSNMPAPESGRWQLVEAGAHDGRLALDVLRWLRERQPEILARVNYCVVEPSAARRAWQRETLTAEFSHVTWVEDITDLSVHGIIFSNEVLDAMPVHRLCWDKESRGWREWRVGWDGNAFLWKKGDVSTEAEGALPGLAAEVLDVLPHEFVLEVSPAANQWWRRAAASLTRGKLLTLDYGFDRNDWLQPERSGGTARAYRRQRVAPDVLADPGAQDITAHVNFGGVRALGEAAGLRTEFLARQSLFLTNAFKSGLARGAGFAEWTSAEVRQFHTLTHPEHLGERFQVLVQARP